VFIPRSRTFVKINVILWSEVSGNTKAGVPLRNKRRWRKGWERRLVGKEKQARSILDFPTRKERAHMHTVSSDFSSLEM